ncbi:MAG TPA: ERF family protein [Pyrinomonadaceae bacterium]|nr:ERF family protein [Pyrinomonadaceae bacterium]
MNIYQRINEVRKAIGYVQKDKDVSTGDGSYKAVTHDAVTGMVRDALIKQGVVIVPSVLSAVFHPKEPAAKRRLYEATYQIEFVNIDDPADKITTQQNAHALDSGDKAPGKAMSYATKYAILKIFNIETGEDEESRYQQEEFNLDEHIKGISEAKNLDELKSLYAAAYSAAGDVKDKAAQKRIIIEKDKRKSALEIELAGQA